MSTRTSLRTAALAAACGACAIAATSASAASPTQLPVPRRTVTARVEHAVRSGQNHLGAPARLPASEPRVFANSRTGVATADEPVHANAEGAVYPLRTTDGGRHWTIDGPLFELPGTADAGVSLGELGIASPSEYWAYGPGTQILFVTDSAGRSWYEVPFGNSVQSLSHIGHDLVAYVGASNASGSRGVVWQYISGDGGHVWHYSTLMPPA